MGSVLRFISMRFDVYMFLLMIGVGLFLILFDTNNLKKKNLAKDAKVAKTIGYTYVLLSVVIYIVKSIWIR